MNMLLPYSHQPVEWLNEDGEPECRRCPRPLTGWGPSLRHADEAVRPVEIAPEEIAVVEEAREVVREALESMWTDRCTDVDRAQVAVAALHRRGLVSARPRRRRSSRAA